MKNSKKITAVIAALVGLGAVALGSVSQPALAQVLPRPIAHPRQAGIAERHPEIRRALRNLEQAKSNLQNAAHDFKGHREQALDLVQRAISQCQQALQADK